MSRDFSLIANELVIPSRRVRCQHNASYPQEAGTLGFG